MDTICGDVMATFIPFVEWRDRTASGGANDCVGTFHRFCRHAAANPSRMI